MERPAHLTSNPMQAAADRAPRSGKSTILILSGFLAGLACAKVVRPEMEIVVFGAAAAGLVAYLALEHLARGRQAIDRDPADEPMTRLERRLDRHIPRGAAVRRPQSVRQQPNIDHQFLTVPTIRKF